MLLVVGTGLDSDQAGSAGRLAAGRLPPCFRTDDHAALASRSADGGTGRVL